MNRKPRVSWGLAGLLLLLLAVTVLGCSRERPQIDNSADWQKLTPSAPGTSPVITTTLVPEVVATQAPATVPTTVVVTIPSESWSYIVQAGDTMTSIAQRFGTDVAVLVALNGITDAAQIKIGQTLKIHGQKPANVTTVSGGATAGRHVVQRGETLSQIARRYNTTVAELQRLNNLANPGLIVAGQVIQLPSGTTGSTTTGGQQTYVVQRGDTLSQIAERFGVSTTDLARANGITNPRLIYAGQQLVIP